jgi:hypothetical protein
MASYTGHINTKGEWVKVSTKTGFTFTADKYYTMQIQNQAWLKVDDAEFFFEGEKFQYKHGTSDLYIKTGKIDCVLTILEE